MNQKVNCTCLGYILHDQVTLSMHCVDCHFLGWYQQFETLAFLAHIQNYIIISSYSNLSTFKGL